MIKYSNDPMHLIPDQLQGFFIGWRHKPDPGMHLKILKKSTYVIYAQDAATNQVIGYTTAMSDKLISAYIPLLEVLPTYQRQGIGTKLLQLIMEEIGDLYMIDLCCDEDLKPFYSKLGFSEMSAMGMRKYAYQSGRT
jgi:ribosomal protein S18 acetylase RimI-like enzyme